MADSKRDRAAALPNPAEVIQQARDLREKGLAAMEALAANEDKIARIHDDLADAHPRRQDEYRRKAEQARIAARKAREVVRKFSG